MPNKQPELTHHIRQDADVFIVSLRGHLDSAAARGMKPKTDELLNGGARRVVFDSLDAALAASRMARSGTAPSTRSAFVSRRSLVNRLQRLNFDVTVANLRVMPRFNPWKG